MGAQMINISRKFAAQKLAKIGAVGELSDSDEVRLPFDSDTIDLFN